MLRRESFFRFNRMMLLGILFLSLALPLCNVPWMSLDHQPVVQAAQLQMLELGIPVHVLPEVQVVADGVASQETSRFSVFFLVSLIYIIGMVLLLATRLWQVGRLQFGLRKGALWNEDRQGIRIYCHAGEVAPFSWMRSIVISEKDYDEAGREIILHEMGHIQGCHSWDVVLLTLVQMLQWWNPLAYALGISLRDVHEYEADDYVLRQGVSAQSYQLLLIKKAVGSGSYAFANSFNHSLTKKRITMMKRIKSNPWMRSKALYVIPVAALALSAFATPKFVAPIEDAVSKLEDKGTENSPNLQVLEGKRKVVELKEAPRIVVDGKEMNPHDAIKAVQGKEIKISLSSQSNTLSIGTTQSKMEAKEDSIYNVVAHNASYPGGDTECFKFLSENVRYPKLCHYYGFQGRVIVEFVIEKDGSISNIHKVRGPGKELSQVDVVSYKNDNPDATELPKEGQNLGDLLYEEVVRVMKLMPKWEPAEDKDGNIVRSRFILPFIFRLN